MKRPKLAEDDELLTFIKEENQSLKAKIQELSRTCEALKT